MYTALAPITKQYRALQFAPDKTLVESNFKSLTFSTYNGENSMDMMNTGLPAGSYDIIVSNHVLEHVKDASIAIREMIRVAGNGGVVHICIPSPAIAAKTKDWGFADPARMWHYRHYGADAGYLFSKSVSGLHVICGVGRDRVTDTYDFVYWLSMDDDCLLKITTYLQRNQFAAVMIS